MPLPQNQLDPDEEVIALLQEHWVTMVGPFFIYLLGWLFFFFFFFIAGLLKTVSLIAGFFVLIFAFCILLVGHHFFFLYLIEYLVSSLIITNKRLIEIRFFPFFLDDVSYIEINQIHEIDKIKHGLLQNLLNYGEVCFNVLRRRESIIFRNVRYPSKFINMIEAIKVNKPLIKGDLKAMGASCPKKYRYLLE